MRGERHPHRAALISAVARDLVDGLRVLRAQPTARALLPLPVAVVFLAANASLTAVLIPFGVQRLGGSEQTGLLFSCLGVGFLIGAPVIRVFLDRAQPRNLLVASLAATAGAYFLLFTSASLVTALPAAVAVTMTGSMVLVVQQTTLQRVIPGVALGRASAVFLTGEAAATLIGSVAGPFLAGPAGLVAVATVASLVTLGAAALAFLTMPPDASNRHLRSQRPAAGGATNLVEESRIWPVMCGCGDRVDGLPVRLWGAVPGDSGRA